MSADGVDEYDGDHPDDDEKAHTSHRNHDAGDADGKYRRRG